jgi:hypothetical protein
MSSRRLATVAAFVAVFCAAAGPASAQTGPPRWFAKETGVTAPLNEQGGLVEPQSPETIASQGATKVFGRRANTSECLTKDEETISNPENQLLPGTGELTELELLCEKSTGFGNYAEPYPCAFGEPFELKAVELNWTSTLEAEEPAKGKKYLHYYDNFPHAAIEVYCLVSKEHDVYRGDLRPEVDIGRFQFRGAESGELNDEAGYHLALKGYDYIAPARYKNIRVRADYEEKLAITGLSPSGGPSGGGTKVTVEGSGFALGDETIFDFGKAAGSSVECMLSTECTVISPSGAAGTVHVIAIVGSTTSKKNDKGNTYTYE